MARGRMINQTIAKDKRLNELSIEAELVYLKTIPHLDKDGLILADTLWADVCPRRKELFTSVDDIICEWIQSGLVVKYHCDDGTVLYFQGFQKNQIGLRYDREPDSLYPPPPGYERNGDGLVPVECDDSVTACDESVTSENDATQPEDGNAPEDIRLDAGSAPDDGRTNIKEVNIREENTHAPAHAREANPLPPPAALGQRRPPRRDKQLLDELRKQVERYGLDMLEFRKITDAILEAFGKKELADTDTGLGTRALSDAQECAVGLIALDAQFRKAAAVERVMDSWRSNDYRGDTLPTYAQFLEHASAMKNGTVQRTRKTPRRTGKPVVIRPPANVGAESTVH